MAQKTPAELNAEIKTLTDTLKKKDEAIKGINSSIEKANQAIEENKTLKKEISELGKNLDPDVKKLQDEIKVLKSAKTDKPAKETTNKERGYTTIMDIQKFKEQSIKNAPEKNEKK